MTKEQRAKHNAANHLYKMGHERLRFLRDLQMSVGCCICGFNDSSDALQCHHIIPEEKDFRIAENTALCINKYTDEEFMEELDKCAVVCANHHLELQAVLNTTKYPPEFFLAHRPFKLRGETRWSSTNAPSVRKI